MTEARKENNLGAGKEIDKEEEINCAEYGDIGIFFTPAEITIANEKIAW